jgi:hypothetical protein
VASHPNASRRTRTKRESPKSLEPRRDASARKSKISKLNLMRRHESPKSLEPRRERSSLTHLRARTCKHTNTHTHTLSLSLSRTFYISLFFLSLARSVGRFRSLSLPPPPPSPSLQHTHTHLGMPQPQSFCFFFLQIRLLIRPKCEMQLASEGMRRSLKLLVGWRGRDSVAAKGAHPSAGTAEVFCTHLCHML